MAKPPLDSKSTFKQKSSISEETLSRLRREARSPYRSLRQFIYLAFAASALIGGFIFFFKLLAGQDTSSTLPNLTLQLGVFTLMIWLFRLERRKSQ